MKRGGVLVLLLLIVFNLFLISFVQAQVNSTEEDIKVNKAYSCLSNKTSDSCDDLSTEEKIFTVLSLNQCRAELNSDSLNSGQCWPSSNCKVKTTGQAIIAFDTSSTAARDWLYTKRAIPSELSWYLEIESDAATSCTISYGSSSYVINIDENRQIDTNAGSCLFPAQNNYWLQVSQSCYNTEFTISCSQSFLTTTLFTKSADPATVHISEETSSASAGGSTRETVNSYCFAESGACNYEATLWASLALDSLGEDVSAYLPYLITLADNNDRYLPDAFLYALTGNQDYKISLLSKQKSSQWWAESGDRYYDTALALYPLIGETAQEKTNAKEWLLNSQDSNGCWENNIRNTGFILASAWPKIYTPDGDSGVPDCESSGFYCASSTTSCLANGGEVLSQYDCSGIGQKCCSVQTAITQTCAELGGEICSASESCVGGVEQNTPDLIGAEICCAGNGDCRPTSTTGEETLCEINNGICRTGGCGSNEEASSYACSSLSQTCCVQESGGPFPPPGDGSSLWVWILIILIVLVVIGIIFRNKLRMLWFRMSGSKGTKPGPPSHGPPHFPQYIQRPIQRIERRILVPQHHAAPAAQRPMARIKSGAQKELDEVLRKLKEMGK